MSKQDYHNSKITRKTVRVLMTSADEVGQMQLTGSQETKSLLCIPGLGWQGARTGYGNTVIGSRAEKVFPALCLTVPSPAARLGHRREEEFIAEQSQQEEFPGLHIASRRLGTFVPGD